MPESQAEKLKNREWKLNANAEYQKGIAIVMNLTTASLVLPILYLKDFVGVPEHRALLPYLSKCKVVFWSWGFLVASLFFGMTYYWASGKFVKKVYEGPEARSEESYEHFRDWSIRGMLVCFAAGLGFLLWFLLEYDAGTLSCS